MFNLSPVREEWGIVPRLFEKLFVANNDPAQKLKVRFCKWVSLSLFQISLLEIYREQLKDLLVIPSDTGGGARAVSPNTTLNNLKIRQRIQDSGDVSVYVENLSNL